MATERLGASNLTVAEATESQTVPDFVGSCRRAFEFFEGVTSVIVPDQLKSAVVKSDRYEPEIQRTFHEFAEHYGTVVMPARPRHPRDKAKVEVAVQVVERWILARMRKEPASETLDGLRDEARGVDRDDRRDDADEDEREHRDVPQWK